MKLFRNCRIYTPQDNGTPRSGKDQGEIVHIESGALLVEDGKIIAIGGETDVLKNCSKEEVIEEIDCRGKCMVPGFVDPHTHMCFAALREKEFVKRIEGAEYLEILKNGGGILSSVEAVAKTDVDQLVASTAKRVARALSLGTTTVEIKSGYGLDTQNELKMLEAIAQVAAMLPVDIVATFLGAHAIPPRFKNSPDQFITYVIEEMLPAIQQQGIASQCDIFCEKEVFSIAQGRRLLQEAKRLGMAVKLHADEVHDLGGAALAAELGALSADHLLAVSVSGIGAMADGKVIAILLPATAYSLKKTYAPARMFIAHGVPVALATDCNPGSSYTESMPFVIGLAVMCMEMLPAEALVAATLNAAYALGKAKEVGSLDPGKQADFLLLDGETPAILAYHAGVSPVEEVYKKGELVSADMSDRMGD